MTPLKKLIETVYMPGRPVRLKRKNTRPPGVPFSSLPDTEGIILKAIEMPDGTIKVYIETDVQCNAPPRLVNKDEIELLEVSEEILRKHLSGRSVHFPRSSGIGIKFPSGASDYADILAVNYRNARLSLSLGLEYSNDEGKKRVQLVIADFSQCDLVPCKGADDE